jgi:hypothetical protein
VKIFTESGSVYDFDLSANTVRRVPDPDGADLRKDDEIVPIISLPYPPSIGRPFIMALDIRGDGVATVRKTTAITKIEA